MGSEKNEKGNKEHHNDDETCFEAFLESLFHQVGLAVAYNPWRCIVATLVSSPDISMPKVKRQTFDISSLRLRLRVCLNHAKIPYAHSSIGS